MLEKMLILFNDNHSNGSRLYFTTQNKRSGNKVKVQLCYINMVDYHTYFNMY